jgi:hypothetical protein
VLAVSAGNTHTCAIRIDGEAVCWGYNGNGQASVPADLGTVSQIATGLSSTCALKVNGQVVCWGWNGSGQTDVPADLGRVSQVTVSGNHACAIKVSGQAACWGSDTAGESSLPGDLGIVTQIAAGGAHTCALKISGTLVCWGQNENGQSTVPSDLGAVSQISAGSAHTCALKIDRTVACWGSDIFGAASVPSDLGAVSQINAGTYLTCAVKVNGKPLCWGENSEGQATVPVGDFPSLSGLLVDFGNPDGIDFGDVNAGQRSAVLTVPVLSSALAPGAAAKIKSVAFASGPGGGNGGGAYSIVSDYCSGVVLDDGAYCTVGVRFSPKIYERDAVSGAIEITDDSTVGTHTIILNATSLPPASLTIRNFSWTPRAWVKPGFFHWEQSDAAKVTLTMTQPVKQTVIVKRGSKRVKKTVTVIKPVLIRALSGVHASESDLPWDPAFGGKPPVRGRWTVTLTAASAHGKASVSIPVVMGCELLRRAQLNVQQLC